MNNRDTMGDAYEYVLGKNGINGVFASVSPYRGEYEGDNADYRVYTLSVFQIIIH